MVTILKKEIQTNLYPVNLATDGLAGMIPVFEEKKEAEEFSAEYPGSCVMQIGFVLTE